VRLLVRLLATQDLVDLLDTRSADRVAHLDTAPAKVGEEALPELVLVHGAVDAGLLRNDSLHGPSGGLVASGSGILLRAPATGDPATFRGVGAAGHLGLLAEAFRQLQPS
jgi:hypothetical protein